MHRRSYHEKLFGVGCSSDLCFDVHFAVPDDDLKSGFDVVAEETSMQLSHCIAGSGGHNFVSGSSTLLDSPTDRQCFAAGSSASRLSASSNPANAFKNKRWNI